MKIVQVYTWSKDPNECDMIFINVEMVESIKLCFHDSSYKTIGLYGASYPKEHVDGLSVFHVTMTSGQIIAVPVPWVWDTSIWKQLQIDHP